MARFCGNCGAQMGSEDRCPSCGWSMPTAPAQNQSVKPKKKPKKLIWILAAGLLAALAILLALHFLGVLKLPLPEGGSVAADIPRETWTRPAAEDYLSSYGSVTGQESAKGALLLTEAEAVRAYADRGFAEVEIRTCYDANGNYFDDRAISDDSSEKHPYYETYFRTEEDTIWTVTLMGDSFYATPVSYNAVELGVPRVLSETEVFRSYDGQANAFFALEPDPEVLVLKRIDRIDAATLAEMRAWEVREP